jgi:TonB family protein
VAAPGPLSGGAPHGDGAGASQGSAGDPLALIQAQLAKAAQGCYPKAARRLGLQGEAKVRFCVGADGQAGAVAVEASSGEELLDQAASECVVRRAAPFPPVDRCLVVPVRFAVPGS